MKKLIIGSGIATITLVGFIIWENDLIKPENWWIAAILWVGYTALIFTLNQETDEGNSEENDE